MVGDVFSFLADGANWSGPTGIGAFLLQQLLLTFTALVLAMLVGLPLAMYAGHRHRGGFLAINVSNVGRAVPVFAVLLVLSLVAIGSDEFGPYGRAGLATLIALVLFALPPLITNTYVGITEVDADIVEASRGMGMGEGKVFTSVELQLAMPVIMTGVRLALVQVWATATIAAIAGGGGLGDIIVNQASYRLAGVVGAALCVCLLAFAVDAAFAGVQRLLTPAPLRGALPGIAPQSAPPAQGS